MGCVGISVKSCNAFTCVSLVKQRALRLYAFMLQALLADLSRSQQRHLAEMHPYKPFPTAALERAVGAVPVEDYPEPERRLARFGREFVFR